MKKITLIILFVFIFSFVSGCTNFTSNSDIFFYQDEFSAEISLNLNGQNTVFQYEKRSTGTQFHQIIFVLPSTLEGYILKSENGVTNMAYGDVAVEATSDMALILDLMSAIFSLNKEQIQKISTEKSVNANDHTKVYLQNIEIIINSETGLPLAFSGNALNCDFEVKITTFSLINQED